MGFGFLYFHLPLWTTWHICIELHLEIFKPILYFKLSFLSLNIFIDLRAKNNSYIPVNTTLLRGPSDERLWLYAPKATGFLSFLLISSSIMDVNFSYANVNLLTFSLESISTLLTAEA